MRRIMLTVALMLWASQIEAAVLFPPDFFRLDVDRSLQRHQHQYVLLAVRRQPNPFNELSSGLQSFPDPERCVDRFPLPYAGSIPTCKAPTTDYLGLDANFSLRVKFTAWGASLPESLAAPERELRDDTGQESWG